mgnify:CR=1 FL=1
MQKISKSEYAKLLQVAQNEGKERLLLIMETICATGIRVSEVKYITKESLNCGKAEITLKGKVRLILIPQKLCRKLNKYVRKKKITSGEIFLTEDRLVMLESAYYNPDDANVPNYIKDIFDNGLPADFRLVGATTRQPEGMELHF